MYFSIEMLTMLSYYTVSVECKYQQKKSRKVFKINKKIAQKEINPLKRMSILFIIIS